MLKWEKYNKLTEEEKEEYNYKFRHKPIIFSINGMIYTVIILTNAITFLFFSLYINLKEKVLEPKQLTTILTTYGPIIQVILIAFLVYMAAGVIQVLFYGITEYLWKKKHNLIKKKIKVYNIKMPNELPEVKLSNEKDKKTK